MSPIAREPTGQVLLMAVVLLATGLTGCSTCPGIDESSFASPAQVQDLRQRLVEHQWQASECYRWNEEKGRKETRDCVGRAPKTRWFFKPSGKGSHLDRLSGGATEWMRYTWRLDGNHLDIDFNNYLGGYNFEVRAHGENGLAWRTANRCRVWVMKPYQP